MWVKLSSVFSSSWHERVVKVKPPKWPHSTERRLGLKHEVRTVFLPAEIIRRKSISLVKTVQIVCYNMMGKTCLSPKLRNKMIFRWLIINELVTLRNSFSSSQYQILSQNTASQMVSKIILAELHSSSAPELSFTLIRHFIRHTLTVEVVWAQWANMSCWRN